jgi:hypothetical protein
MLNVSSIGLKSGDYGDKEPDQTVSLLKGCLNPSIQMDVQIVQADHTPGLWEWDSRSVELRGT